MATSNRGGGPGGRRQAKVRLKTAKQRSASSQRWLERQLNDPYVAAAKREGYRSRAAFKLAEIDAKHRLLKPGKRVVDLGAAPGGWAQVAADRVKSVEGKGQVVAIDLLEMEPIAGVQFLKLDFMDDDGAGAGSRPCCAMAAPISSSPTWPRRAPGTSAPIICASWGWPRRRPSSPARCSAPGGAFVCKVFQGGTERQLLDRLKRAFTTVKHVKPPASRQESAEMYVVALGFRGERQSAASSRRFWPKSASALIPIRSGVERTANQARLSLILRGCYEGPWSNSKHGRRTGRVPGRGPRCARSLST